MDFSFVHFWNFPFSILGLQLIRVTETLESETTDKE